jgi:tRNA-dihydrouridine synthase B
MPSLALLSQKKNKTSNPIKDIIDAKIFMSPMAGVTDMPFRAILQKQGCRFAFTEMVDVNGLFYNNKKTSRMLIRTHDTITYGAQIVGSDLDKILTAAKICEESGYSVLELNAGCPVKKVVKDGKGSALLKDPKKLGKIVANLVKELTIPVTVKIRSGWDDKSLNYFDVAKMIEDSGASAICIHPRTKTQMYKGKPDHTITKRIKESIKIPVFASGNAFNCDAIKDIFESTGCDAVAIARGTLGKPWIFKQTYDNLNGKNKLMEPAFNELKAIVQEHLQYSIDFHGREKAFHIMYKHLQWYFKNHKNRIAVMQRYREITNINGVQSFVDNLQIDQEGGMYIDERNNPSFSVKTKI